MTTLRAPQKVVDAAMGALGGFDMMLEPHQADELLRPWSGRLFLFPPYGRAIATFVAKLIDEYERGLVTQAVLLVPARTDTRWFAALRRYACCFVDGRLRLTDEGGSAPFPSAVFYLGPDVDRFARASAVLGDTYVQVSRGVA